MTRLRSLLRALRGRNAFEDEMAEEVRFHIEEYARDLQAGGLAPDEALRRARQGLGSLDAVKDDCRQARGLRFFDELQQDLRLAVRAMRRTPGFTATALAIVALGLGANLSLFAVVDAVLLRALPIADAERLVRVFNTYPKAGVADDGSSITNYYERRGRIPALSSIAVYREGAAVVGPVGATAREPILQVSPEFFATLGKSPVLGRAFLEEETLYGTDGVAILSDAYWRQRLDADPRVIGRVVRVDGLDKRVVGVLPADFSYLSSPARLFLPYASHPDDRVAARRHWGSSSQMIGRLAPGATLEQAQAQIDAQNVALEKDDPAGRKIADAGFRTLVVPLRADHVAGVRPLVLMVQAGGLVLLLIGAVNLTNLLLVRASGKAKELAVRQALGAGRGRLLRTVLTETLLLALGGGLLGLGVATFGVRLLRSLGIGQLPLGASIGLDGRVAVAGLLGALVLGMAIGIPVAWHDLAGSPAAPLRSESRSATASRATLRLRHGFLVAQVALAFVLLSGAGSLALSLRRVMAVSPGFRPENVQSGHLALPWKSYPDSGRRLAFVERLLEAVSRLPGVQSAGVISNVPLSGNITKNAVTLVDTPLQAGVAPQGHYAYGVGGDALRALGLRLAEGRLLEAADSRRPERVCVVDEDFARHYWPDGHVLGQRLFHGGQPGAPGEAFTVVGVVGAVKQASLTDDTPQGAVYYPYAYWPGDNDLFVVVRTAVAPQSLAGSLQEVVRSIDPELPVSDVRTMATRLLDSLVTRRSPAVLAGLFSCMALLLTAIGTYGVLAYAVAQRRREIGLRMALGARPEQVGRQFLIQALRLLAVGVLLGAGGAAVSGRGLRALLYQIPSVPAEVWIATGVLLGAVSLLACLLPVRQATRVEPAEALAEP